ncbi:MAG: amino acid ABC transporter permease [Gammaproteobacteria bacterium]|nr:amino acid ABC transporter permease [Gammaproteobacteria bacterium]
MKPKPVLAALLITCLLLLAGCASSQQWGWYVVNPMVHRGRINLLFLMSGIPWTIMLTICCVLISNLLGFFISLLGLARQRIARLLYRGYVDVFRSIPPLVSIFWVYYGLPVLIDVGLEPFPAGMLALSLYGSAFMAEIFRGGVQSIDRGQFEAAHTLGLGYLDTMRFVIFPQALRRSLPAIGNQLVIMLKMTSLVSVIGVSEVLRRGNELAVTEYRPLEIYTFVALQYLVLVLIVSAGVRKLERRMGSDERQAGRTANE